MDGPCLTIFKMARPLYVLDAFCTFTKKTKCRVKNGSIMCKGVIGQIAWRWLHVDQFLFCVLIWIETQSTGP